MTIGYIISQIIVLFAILCCVLSYFTKNRTLILVLRIITALSYTTSYILLNAIAGAITNIVAISLAVVLFFYTKKDKDCPLWLLLVFECMIVTSCVIFWDGYATIFVLAAHIVDMYSVWQKDVKIYRWLSLPVSVFFGVYSVLYASYVAAIFEVVVLMFKILSIVDYYKFKKKQQN